MQKVRVEAAVRISGAVRRDQNVGSVEVGRAHGDQPELDRPMGQRARGGFCRGAGRGRLAEGSAPAAGTAALLRRVSRLCLRGEHRRMVVGGRLPLLKGDCAGRTGGEAVPKPVAVVLPEQAGFSVDHSDRSLVAGVGAKAAAVAFFLVNFDYFTDHVFILQKFIRLFWKEIVFLLLC